jgi:NAD(P)-dependent dehydrogenase (short-subunit alcohol dehydrogenase family)
MTDSAPGVALVTGAARRIGRAIALDLGRRGWAVAVHYRASAAEAHAVVREIADSGGRAAALHADLRDEARTRALVGEAARALGRVDLLVNNASVFENDDVRTTTRASWDAHMEANLRAPFVLAQEFAAQPDAAGNIVNMADERVWKPTPYFASYTLSKAGLWTLTRTLALALAPRIRVNAIGPGPTLPSPRQSEAQFARQVAALPLRHGPTLEEICDAVRFILAARSMTGQMIALDGGQHLGWAHPSGEKIPEE